MGMSSFDSFAHGNVMRLTICFAVILVYLKDCNWYHFVTLPAVMSVMCSYRNDTWRIVY